MPGKSVKPKFNLNKLIFSLRYLTGFKKKLKEIKICP